MESLELYDYQLHGAKWLAAKPFALLADEMGLGKSPTAIRACDIANARTVLVVCPASLTENWRREFLRFGKLKRSLEVVSFDSLARNLAQYTHRPFDALIIDEVQYCKEPTAARTRAVFGNGGVVRGASRIWCLSGTPAPNHAAELWVMLRTFGLTSLGFEAFIHKYCVTNQIHPKRVQILGTRTEKISEVRAMLAPVILRRTKQEVLPQLPLITFGDIFVDKTLQKIPHEVVGRLEAEFKMLSERLELADMLQPESDAQLLLMLEGMAQSVSTLRRYNGIQKAPGAGMLIAQELADCAYEKVVMFAIHREVVEMLRVQFPDAAVITGETPVKKRQAEVDRFQKDSKCNAFIGNIHAAGTGLTLTAAHHVVFVEFDWVPGNNAQAAMRCHRIGQDKNVTVRFVSIPNSIDEKITAVIKRKTKELALLFQTNAH